MVVVVLDVNKTNCDTPALPSEGISLREETRRTGRYVAAGTAIGLSLLGVYQALVRGTPEYAALFAPAVIMFVYILWILYASKNQNSRLLRTRVDTMEAIAEEDEEEFSLPATTSVTLNVPSTLHPVQHPSGSLLDSTKNFNRSYSIA